MTPLTSSGGLFARRAAADVEAGEGVPAADGDALGLGVEDAEDRRDQDRRVEAAHQRAGGELAQR
jgi:hypothetical protein